MGTEKSEREKKKNDDNKELIIRKEHSALSAKKPSPFFPIQDFWIFPHVLKNVWQTLALLTYSKKNPSSMYSLRPKKRKFHVQMFKYKPNNVPCM